MLEKLFPPRTSSIPTQALLVSLHRKVMKCGDYKWIYLLTNPYLLLFQIYKYVQQCQICSSIFEMQIETILLEFYREGGHVVMLACGLEVTRIELGWHWLKGRTQFSHVNHSYGSSDLRGKNNVFHGSIFGDNNCFRRHKHSSKF